MCQEQENMAENEHESREILRRDAIKGAIAAAGGALSGGSLAGNWTRTASGAPPNAELTEKSIADQLRAENARAGSGEWQLTYTRIDPATKYRSPWIEGYVSRASVRAGDKLDLM